jgi:biopolymer transport protein ExbD
MLLLVFFMATTSTEPPKSVEIDLPKGRTESAEQDTLYITISKSNQVYFDGRLSSIEDIRDQLALREGEKDRPVSITADKNLNYSSVASILGVLREYDFLNILFMSQPKDE